MKSNKVLSEIHSEAVQHVVNRPPSWLVSWGISICTLVFILLITASFLVRYPDVVAASVLLTSKDAPRPVLMHSDGRLARLLVKEDQFVRKNQLVGVTESIADYNEVLNLASQVDRLVASMHQNDWKFISLFDGNSAHELGELQADYELLNTNVVKLKTVLSEGFYLQKRKLLLEEIGHLKSLESNISKRIELQQKDLTIAEGEFAIHRKLYNDKVISPLEYRREESKLINREIPVMSLGSVYIETKTLQAAKQKEILELDHSIYEHKLLFLQTLQTFKSRIEAWKQKYLLVAPTSGRVSLSGPWQEHQFFPRGYELMTVEPASGNYEGIVRIPQKNMGKLRKGLKVYIKLDGYPYREYGMLEGVLGNISKTLGQDSLYWGQVILSPSLKTEYGQKIRFRAGMKGRADIITADRVLAERLVSIFKSGRQ